MIIVLEGPDGTGKSTLAKKLNECYGYELITAPVRGDSMYSEWINLITKCKHKTVIVDRSFISEIVYRLLDGDKSSIRLQSVLELCNYVKVIYCNNPSGHYYARKRGEDNIVDSNQWYKLNDIYKIVFKILGDHTFMKIFEYDFILVNESELFSFINKE